VLRSARGLEAAEIPLNTLLLPLVLLGPATGAPPPAAPCAACVTWELTLTQAALLLAAPGSLEGLDLLLRPGPGDADPSAVLAELAARGARTGLVVSRADIAPPAARVARRILIDPGTGDDLDRLAFDVKTRATEIRAVNGQAEVGLETGEDSWARLDKRGVGPYLDFLVGPTRLDGASRPTGLPVWVRTGPRRSVEGDRSVEGVLHLTAAHPGRRLLSPAPDDGGRTLLALRGLAGVLPEGLTPLPAVAVSCPQDGCESRVFLHPGTLDAIAIVTPRASARALTVEPGALRLEIFPVDPGHGAHPGSALTPRAGIAGAAADLPPGLGPFILKIGGWRGGDRFAAGVEVTGERPLTVEEVVARHQAGAARQRQVVSRLISSGSMVVTFQVPGLAAPVTVTSDVVVYEDGGAREIEQRSIRLNGVDQRDGAGVPRLPIIEPERVTAPPMAITLDEAYRYRLDSREEAFGQDCYVVAFEPVSRDRPLFRGRAWIAARGFALVRAEAVQTGLRGPIVSSEQRDVFAAVPVADGVAWLPARSEVHQVYEGPGHRTPIERVVTLTRLEPNPPDFAARRAAAHASPSVMLADTPTGYRYLRQVESGSRAAPARREPAGKASRVRAVVAGVLVDPGISRPLPFAGLSYVDFDFLGTGAQVNGFFGGVFAQLAWTVPSVGGSRWRLQGSGLAILAPYNDRAFAGGVERYHENLRQRPARVAVAAARPLSARTRVRVGYELDYTRLARSDSTAADFVVPVSPVVHGLRVAVEAERAGWSASAWWNGARRQRWRPWGFPGSEPGGAGFQRFGASAGRSFVLSPRSVARLDGAWMGGRGLDRFSRYSFDGFENRLRGYPTATVRYDRGAVAHGVLTWSAARKVRLDGFLDVARVRDPGFGPRPRTYVGAGAAVEAPLPLRALASLEWGYGFQARGPAGETGTHVVRLTAYKVF